MVGSHGNQTEAPSTHTSGLLTRPTCNGNGEQLRNQYLKFFPVKTTWGFSICLHPHRTTCFLILKETHSLVPMAWNIYLDGCTRTSTMICGRKMIWRKSKRWKISWIR